MPNSYQLHTATGSASSFSFADIDGFLSTDHLKVYLNGTKLTSGYTLNTSNKTVTLSATPGAGAAVRIQRETPKTLAGRLTDFVDGSVLTAEALDTANIQNLFIAQEAADSGNGGMQRTADDGAWDAVNIPIERVGLPLSTSDAATKQYVDNLAYANAFGLAPGAVAQAWTISAVAGQMAYTLSNPTPAAVDANMYIVLIDGVVQKPSSYTITESGGVYTLTLLGETSDIATDSDIHVRNFGIARTVSGSVNSSVIENGAVTADKLALNAVTTSKIMNEQVTTDKISPSAVTSDKIAPLAVTEGKIASLAVTEGKIASLAVTEGKIGASAVTTDKIAAGAVIATKLASSIPVLQQNASTTPVGTIRALTGTANLKLDVPGDSSQTWFVFAVLKGNATSTALGNVKTDFVAGGSTTFMPATSGYFWTAAAIRIS